MVRKATVANIVNILIEIVWVLASLYVSALYYNYIHAAIIK